MTNKQMIKNYFFNVFVRRPVLEFLELFEKLTLLLKVDELKGLVLDKEPDVDIIFFFNIYINTNII